MRIIKSLVALTVVITMLSCQNQPKADVTKLETEIDSASYALGLDMALKVKANFGDAKTDLFLQGYRNGMDSTNMLIKEKDLGLFLRVFFQKQQMEKQQEMAEKNYGDNKKAGEKFMAENKTRDGVITTESGLQYMVLKEGKGDKPKPTSKIKIHYHGTTIKGEVFDSSVNKGEPFESLANIYIPGFNEGLLLMSEGAKYKFFIPQDLAYGVQQRGALILPFSALIFEVELLEILEK